MKESYNREDRGPGVPEAVPRCLQKVAAHFGAAALDRVWVFPPLVSGRSESGLLAVSHLPAESDDADRRLLSILPYTAERTGKGLTLDGEISEQGEAPLDRFPRVMEGVVRRTELDLGDPTELEIDGSEEAFWEALAEYDEVLLDPALPPLAAPVVEASVDTEGASPADGSGPGGPGDRKAPERRDGESLADVLLAEAPGDGREGGPATNEATSDPEDELYDLYSSGSSS